MKAFFTLCRIEIIALLSAMNLRGRKREKAFAAPVAALLAGGLMAYIGVAYALPMALTLIPMLMGDLYWGQMVLMAFIGSVTELGLVWNLADLFMALMALVNLAAIAIIGRYAYRALDDYIKQKKAGIENPEFDPKCLGNMRGVQCWPRDKDEEIVQ